MKVIVGKEVYLMHWETRTFNPLTGNNTEKELEATDCIIRKIVSDGNSVEIARGHVSQTSCDQANRVTARRLSFLKAIDIGGALHRGVGEGTRLPRELRSALGREYQRTCRIYSMTANQKNRKLRQRVKDLQKKVAEFEKAAKTEKVVV